MFFIIDFARKGLQKQILYILLLYVITIFRLRLRFFPLNMEIIKVKRSILFQTSYFRKSVVKKLRVIVVVAFTETCVTIQSQKALIIT